MPWPKSSLLHHLNISVLQNLLVRVHACLQDTTATLVDPNLEAQCTHLMFTNHNAISSLDPCVDYFADSTDRC